MSSHEILPALFLSCLMAQVNAEYDLSKLNKEKKLLE